MREGFGNGILPLGFALDICYKIVDEVKATLKLDKLEVKLVPVTSATRIPLIVNGTIDLECASTTNNLERQKLVAFSAVPTRRLVQSAPRHRVVPPVLYKRDSHRHGQLKKTKKSMLV